LSPQKDDSVGPVPRARFFYEASERFDQSADVCRGNCLFVYKDHARMAMRLFRPPLEQRRNRSSVVGDKGESLMKRFLQAHRIFLPEETPAFPFHQAADREHDVTAAQTCSNIRRNMLIQKKLEHVRISRLC